MAYRMGMGVRINSLNHWYKMREQLSKIGSVERTLEKKILIGRLFLYT